MARIGIVAVHGVIPQARYGFQDQVAAALQTALEGLGGSNGPWRISVVFPSPGRDAVASPSTDSTDTPTISRVHRDRDDPNAPQQDFFDVHEAYWSPIDKGKTTAGSVLQWLLTTIFLPINDTARYMERFSKVSWDIGFILTAILAGAVCFVGSFLAAAWALGATRLADPDQSSFGAAIGALANPLDFIKGLNIHAIIALIIGLIGAYLLAQTIRGSYSLIRNVSILMRTDQLQLVSRIIALLILALLAAAGIAYCVLIPIPCALIISCGHVVQTKAAACHIPCNVPLRFPGFVLAATVLLFQSGRALTLWFLVNFFGDVQIYTTRDENSDFFSLREQILDLVTRTTIAVASGDPSGEPYDRVYVLAHSLGSTISMDALMRIYNAQKAGSVSPAAWNRIRGFVTFGTALEKTKYFFNAWSPTQSQRFEEWQNDLYGPLFNADPAALAPESQDRGIYWLNCWYFSDFVSDAISSYRSFVLPGQPPSTSHANRAAAQSYAQEHGVAVAGRLVADNRTRFGDFAPWRLHFVTHGDYLEDQRWFWSGAGNSGSMGVIDVITSGLSWGAPLARLTAQAAAEVLPFEHKPRREAADFLTPDVFK